jgi:hypothetical protein
MTAGITIAILLVLLAVFGIGPALRGTAAAFAPSTSRRNHARDNRDMVRLLVLLVATFALMFAWKLGGL